MSLYHIFNIHDTSLKEWFMATFILILTCFLIDLVSSAFLCDVEYIVCLWPQTQNHTVVLYSAFQFYFSLVFSRKKHIVSSSFGINECTHQHLRPSYRYLVSKDSIYKTETMVLAVKHRWIPARCISFNFDTC